MPDSTTEPSPRGVKRGRTSESPRRSPRRAANGISSPRRATEGSDMLVGSSRDLVTADTAATESEPSTEEEDEYDGHPSQRTLAREGHFSMSLPGEDAEDEEAEPDTEASDEDENGLVAQPVPPRPSTSTADGSAPASRVSPDVLDLTDDGDIDAEDAAKPARTPSSRKLASSSSDELLFVSAPRTKQDKGKGRAVPTPSPSPSTQPPPSAENASPALPSLATLSCPICLGPPTPLALTSCGHAFCAPCLHAALVAGPALTPPPPGAPTGRGRGRGGSRGRARGVGARGGGGRAAGTTATARRGRGRSNWHEAADRDWDEDDEDDGDGDEGDPDLNKHCPVCRTPLYGGWGKSLRGLVIRMAPRRT
ncbi:hypothetical protein JCM11491_004385 [Sporobolomyces phaffii]